MSSRRDSSNVDCEWGTQGLDALASSCDVLIIVDVLSFSTAVEIANSRGARVLPLRWADGDVGAWSAAGETIVAGPRRGEGPSLSPTSLLAIGAGTRLVLPSPNGAELSTRAPGKPVLTGCLRNASAVAEAAARLGNRIGVVPAGERWSDGSLRPAFEDWVGAGAILSHLEAERSPEAEAAVDAFRGARSALGHWLRQCVSGRELIGRGFEQDVALAAQLDVSACVPRLSAEREYVAWRPEDERQAVPVASAR
jgi:2-phosphosulfolactate phosphatase